MTEKKRDVSRLADVCDLSRIDQFSHLPKDTSQELKAMCRVLRFQSGQVVAHEGERTDYIGCVLSGILRIQKTLDDGRQHIVGLMFAGDVFGRVFDGALRQSVEATCDAEIFAFQRHRFEGLVLRCPDLDRAVVLNILNDLDRARDWMILLAKPRIKTRLAGFLVSLCTRYPEAHRQSPRSRGGLLVKIPISRTDLAHLLGTRAESISRAFHALAKDGCIALRRPDLIEVIDMDLLWTQAGEDVATRQTDVQSPDKAPERH